MSIRDYGALDNYLAGMVMHSKLSNKVMSFTVFGSNPDVDTASIEDLWEVGGVYNYLTSQQTIDIASSSVNDTFGGSGIEQVRITGVDDNYDPVSEIINMNGQTTVVTDNRYLRIHSLTAIKDGAVDPNINAAGNIIADYLGDVKAQIFTGRTSARMAQFTVYRGYTAFLKQVWVSGGAGDDFVLNFAIRPQNGIFTSGNDIEISNSSFSALALNPGIGNVKEKSDIKVEVQAVSNNAQSRINYTLIMVKNNFLESLAKSI